MKIYLIQFNIFRDLSVNLVHQDFQEVPVPKGIKGHRAQKEVKANKDLEVFFYFTILCKTRNLVILQFDYFFATRKLKILTMQECYIFKLF